LWETNPCPYRVAAAGAGGRGNHPGSPVRTTPAVASGAAAKTTAAAVARAATTEHRMVRGGGVTGCGVGVDGGLGLVTMAATRCRQ